MEHLRGLKKYKFFRYSTTDFVEGNTFITSGIEKFNRSMGVSFFKRKHNFVNFLFIQGISLLVVYLISVVVSTYKFRNEPTKLVFCLTTLGFCGQAATKIYSFIITRHLVIDLYENNQQYNQTMVNKSNAIKHVLCENVSLVYAVIKSAVIVYTILVILVIFIMPGLSMILFDDRILPFGFLLPFVNADTLEGYILNYIFQGLESIYYSIIAVGSDMTTIYYLLTAYGQLNVLMVTIDELNSQLNRDASLQDIRDKIREIIGHHQYHRAYLEQLVSFLNPYHFVTVGSTVLTMVISVLGFMLLDWLPGMVMTFLGSVQMFYICFLGTSLEIKTDELTEKIGAVRWDKLSISDMKDMQLVLQMAQQPKVLYVATTPLNIPTFVSIHKLIYSLVMMLENTKD